MLAAACRQHGLADLGDSDDGWLEMDAVGMLKFGMPGRAIML